MRRAVSAVSLAGFLLVMMAFLLPFVRLSCGSDDVARLTGEELVVGTHVQQGESGQEGAAEHRIAPSLFAAAALTAAVLGCLLSLPRADWSTIARMAVSAAGFLAMLGMMVDARLRAARAPDVTVTVAFLWPAWAATLVFAAVLCLNAALRGRAEEG